MVDVITRHPGAILALMGYRYVSPPAALSRLMLCTAQEADMAWVNVHSCSSPDLDGDADIRLRRWISGARQRFGTPRATWLTVY